MRDARQRFFAIAYMLGAVYYVDVKRSLRNRSPSSTGAAAAAAAAAAADAADAAADAADAADAAAAAASTQMRCRRRKRRRRYRQQKPPARRGPAPGTRMPRGRAARTETGHPRLPAPAWLPPQR